METFKSLLEYLYTDDVNRNLQQDTLLELLRLAATYQLARLVTLCEYRIIVNLNEDTSCERIIQIYFVAKVFISNNVSREKSDTPSPTHFHRFSTREFMTTMRIVEGILDFARDKLSTGFYFFNYIIRDRPLDISRGSGQTENENNI